MMLDIPVFPQIRVLYVSAVVIVSLFIMAFLWFGLYSVMEGVSTAAVASITQYDVENSTYSQFTLANTFMTNIWQFLLVVIAFGLLYWVWIYSQRKNVVYR